MAVMMPPGTVISTASPTINRVPTIALPKPPPLSIAEGGNWVNTSVLRRRPPRQASIQTTLNNGTSADKVIAVTKPLSRKSSRVRGRRKECSSCPKSTPENGSATLEFDLRSAACHKSHSAMLREAR